MNRREKFERLYKRIRDLNVCGEDLQKVIRKIDKTNIDSEVMVIAEAIASSQVRLSGVNYFHKDGSIGNTGRYLEKFLNKFNYSVYTDRPNCIYHTEIVHSFPGYKFRNGKKSIRRPTESEIQESIESGILEKEINLVDPKVILLMGRTSYETFYKYFLRSDISQKLTSKIESIRSIEDIEFYQNIPVIPIQHASGANPRFYKMLKCSNIVDIIKKFI